LKILFSRPPEKNDSIPPPIRLAARKERAAFGFALAIARTRALDWLQQQAEDVLTPPQQSQSVGFSPFGSSATTFVYLPFLKGILFNFLKKHLKKKEEIKSNRDFFNV